MIRSALLSLALLVAGNARAELPAGTDGVWRGTLGKSEIVACFDGDNGTYYYLKHRRNIQVDRKDATQPYAEHGGKYYGEPTGYWRIDVESGDLRGSWSADSKGSAPLPIKARRVSLAQPDLSPCESAEFEAPRQQSLKLVPREAIQAGLPVRIEKVAGTDIERLQLRGAEPAFAIVNKALDASFREDLANSWDCSEYGSSPALEFADSKWLVVQVDSGMYCGGAHPDSGSSFFVYERSNGHSVDTSTWLVDLWQTAAGSAFWKLAASKLERPDEECVGDWRDGTGSASVRPGPGGVRVYASFPHALLMCEDSVEMSAAQARPFLTPEGRRALGMKS